MAWVTALLQMPSRPDNFGDNQAHAHHFAD